MLFGTLGDWKEIMYQYVAIEYRYRYKLPFMTGTFILSHPLNYESINSR